MIIPDMTLVYKLKMANKTDITVIAANSIISINGTWYKAKDKPLKDITNLYTGLNYQAVPIKLDRDGKTNLTLGSGKKSYFGKPWL